MFRIYDVDGDGIVTASDMQLILRQMAGSTLRCLSTRPPFPSPRPLLSPRLIVIRTPMGLWQSLISSLLSSIISSLLLHKGLPRMLSYTGEGLASAILVQRTAAPLLPDLTSKHQV